MEVLILGPTGILGNTLSIFLKKKKINIICISRKKNNKDHLYLNDFTNFKKLEKLILKIKPTHIINCLGVTKFNNSYKKNLTIIINTKLPKFLAALSLKNKIFFTHISTDCVFSGKKGNYNDTSLKDSFDLYGLTKGRGEVKNKFTTTIRTSFIGPELNSNKSLLSWFLSQKNDVNGFKNAFFSGLTSLELCTIIHDYVLKDNLLKNKILNVGGHVINKYKLLKDISKIFNKKIKINKFSDFAIDRSLNSKRFKKITNYKLKKWPQLLKELKIFMKENKYI